MRCFLLTNKGAATSSSSPLSSLSGICRFGAEHVCDAVSRFSTATATAANDRADDGGRLLDTTSTAFVVTEFDLGNSLPPDFVLCCTAAFALSVLTAALLCDVALKTTGSTENSEVGLGVDDRLDNLTGA